MSRSSMKKDYVKLKFSLQEMNVLYRASAIVEEQEVKEYIRKGILAFSVGVIKDAKEKYEQKKEEVKDE